MPRPHRVLGAKVGSVEVATLAGRADAVAVLSQSHLAEVVDLVACAADDTIIATNASGACQFGRSAPFGVVSVTGRDPLASADPLAFTPLSAEPRTPSHGANAYPFGRERLASLFDDPRAPDLVVVHSAGHYWPERGGHLGEHGSLDAVQSRAPLVLAGAGVTARGVVDDVARVVDVGPTLAWLAGSDMPGVAGRPLAAYASPGARHVVGLLWDGCNANSLLDLATSGALPNVARLLARGCALRGGAVAEFPSVTLTNHTSALTGVGPGRHGILNNEFYDRALGRRVVANDSSTWHTACDLLRPGVATLWEALPPSLRTACVNEPIDRGAGYSTFGIVRARGNADGARGLDSELPSPVDDPHATRSWVASAPGYAWSTSVDALGLAQVVALWSDPATRPDVMWWNSTLTDTGHHAGGPHSDVALASMLDTDRRLGVFLDLVDSLGLADDVVFLLTSDHGSEAASPECRGDWDEELRAAGIAFRDEAYGFVYLG